MTSSLLPRWIGRALGRCPSCKTVVRRDSPVYDMGGKSVVPCPECGNRVTVKAVSGTTSTKECDARCMGAVGPSCDCSCGGENHGAGH